MPEDLIPPSPADELEPGELEAEEQAGPEAPAAETELKEPEAGADAEVDVKAAAMELLKQADPEAHALLEQARTAKDAEAAQAEQTGPGLDAMARQSEAAYEQMMAVLEGQIAQTEQGAENDRAAMNMLMAELNQMAQENPDNVNSAIYARTWQQYQGIKQRVSAAQETVNQARNLARMDTTIKKAATARPLFTAYLHEYASLVKQGVIQPAYTPLDQQETALKELLASQGKRIAGSKQLTKAEMAAQIAKTKKMSMNVGGRSAGTRSAAAPQAAPKPGTQPAAKQVYKSTGHTGCDFALSSDTAAGGAGGW